MTLQPRTYRADAALIDGRFAADVSIAVDAMGDITGVGEAMEGAEPIRGIVVPGMANLHSHAFQRAMAGLAERAGPSGDTFWTWRETMYGFLGALTPDDVQAIAAQLYVECLKHGFTSVGEFHYLHNAPDGHAYDDPAELSWRVLAAAEAAGIGMTLLPVLYQASQFGGVAPNPGQRRFVLDDETFALVCEEVDKRAAAHADWRLGLAPHSLRAVTPDALAEVIALRESMDPGMPIHIHAAEQTKEVEDCLAWSGARPVDWLLDHGAGAGWCLIHATHMTQGERSRLAASGAVAGLCPTTEANLGDGFFALPQFLAAGGAFGIGTDSNVCTSPAEELRLLDYGGRLQRRVRNGIGAADGASIGAALFNHALAGGAKALGRAAGAIAAGHRADLVVLDPDHPSLAGRPLDRILDSFVFSGNATPVRDVMVGGRFVVRDGEHMREAGIRDAFRRSVRRLAASLG